MALEDDLRPLASGDPGANLPAVVTISDRMGMRVQIGWLAVSYSAAPAGGRLTAGDEPNVDVDLDITAAGPTLIASQDSALTFQVGQPVTVTLAPGGAAVHGKVNVGFRYIRDR